MQLSHTRPVAAARFDNPNLVATAGLVPMMALAQAGDLLTRRRRPFPIPNGIGQCLHKQIVLPLHLPIELEPELETVRSTAVRVCQVSRAELGEEPWSTSTRVGSWVGGS